jgi:hypothetical protein
MGRTPGGGETRSQVLVQSPRPWQAAIQDNADHPDKKSAQGQQKYHID